MKTIPIKLQLFLCVLATRAISAEPPSEAGVFDVGGERVRLIGGTLSADGRYVGACAIHADPGKPPVDWEGIAKSERGVVEYVDEEGYKLSNVIVDLERRAIVVRLESSDAYFPNKNHGSFSLAYGPEKDGRRFILVGNAGKWEPSDIRLVEIGEGGAKQIDLLKILNSEVTKHVAKKRGSAERYVLDYWISGLPELGLLSGFANATTLRVPSIAQVPKDEESPSVQASVELRLGPGPQAEVVSIRSTETVTPEPAQDHPEVAAADKELNAAYAELRGKLDAAGKERLREEQREWIQSRDSQFGELLHAGIEGLANPRYAADISLRRITLERAAKLLSQAK